MRQIRFIRSIAIAFSIVGVPFLIAGIITLIDDPDMRKSMSTYGRELVLKEFTIDAMTDKTLAIYKELLQKNRG